MAIEKVREYFKGLGLEDRIQEFDVSSATVDLAAEAVGVEGARICKTLSFKDMDDEEGCILIQTAGDTKINNQKFKKFFGFKAKMLSPDEVLAKTGHAIGGVCAFAITDPKVRIYCDESMKRFTTVFPACGSDNSAIEFTCDELFKYSNALEWIDVSKIPEDEASKPEEGK
ncbi:YbaK/EbsC family protein [Aminicella lysinilytica]|uniref:YbaK/EbsC family protein n=1 Tax=Aminicella lysinilytica TaxID=433323 RepID=UPI0026E9C0FC|nr:YbaK/EbsC family protein [Aminicella lysinilytica]